MKAEPKLKGCGPHGHVGAADHGHDARCGGLCGRPRGQIELGLQPVTSRGLIPAGAMGPLTMAMPRALEDSAGGRDGMLASGGDASVHSSASAASRRSGESAIADSVGSLGSAGVELTPAPGGDTGSVGAPGPQLACRTKAAGAGAAQARMVEL